MALLKKITTAFRGMANEAGEEFVDSQALRILDQEIRDASAELGKSKESLADIIAKRKVAETEAKKIRDNIEKYEGYASAALDNGDETLAVECAEKVVSLQGELEPQEQLIAQFAANESHLKKAVTQAENNLKRIKRQVDTVKATEQVQKAQAAVSKSYAGTNSGVSSAAESLERIKKRQAEQAAKFQATQEMQDLGSDSDLDAKLQAAGIGGSSTGADDVLARLRAKKGKKGAKKS